MPRIAVDERRELLVEAAIRVMVRDGVAKATTRSIVAEAGMALATFHYSFRSKQELLENVIETITAHTLDLAVEVLVGDGSAEDKVRSALDTYWSHVLANPGEHRVTYELTQYALRHPGLATIAKRQYEAYIAAASTLIESLDVAWKAPTPVIARYLISVMDGMTLLWLNEGDDASCRAALDLTGDHLVSLIDAGD
ncbi:TetR/AcrR family transcriptional regulator [Catenulispora rubra]|uniref:TetR/AcrR family transcriptional regulator n=1 Tax=Catenulispora rubra TaxID=280293 RepID=UPI0018921C63|nr:TetR/AcrR family transcriptional regulator [Catenulispora rubra]